MSRNDMPFTPVVISILAFVGWALIMLFYVFFWSSSYDWLQSLAILVLSFIVVAGLVGFMWVYWLHKRT
jgi:heme/copper-type cytochrome/quinol oxidase subunit 4